MLSIIIPAYNEAPRIGRVLKVSLTYPYPKEVIVVDDASTDGTLSAVYGSGAKVLHLLRHGGKGAAMATGIQEAKGNALLFLDADLTGLTHGAIRTLAWPVEQGQASMVAGRVPFLLGNPVHISGERSVSRAVATAAIRIGLGHTGYGADATLNRAARASGGQILIASLPAIGHTQKTLKWGMTGFLKTLTMPFTVARHL